MKRRAAAIMLSLLFLNATLPGGASACASGAAAFAPAEAMETRTAHQHPTPGSATGVKQAESEHDDHQHLPSHCGVAMACSMVAVAEPETWLNDQAPAAARDNWARPGIPHSVGTAPEPPPPRP